jgi:hypothetical protein
MPIVPINITSTQGDETNVNWVENGEYADDVVFNRPIKDVSVVVNTVIDTVNNLGSYITDTITTETNDRLNQIQALVQGSIAYETKSEMDAAGSPPSGELAIVWKDSTTNNNGQYGYSGGAWVESEYDPTNSTTPSNILFDPFNEYAAIDQNFGGWSAFTNSNHEIETNSLNNPFPTPSVKRGTDNNIDRRWEYAKLGVSSGDILTISVVCWFQDSGGELFAYYRELDSTVISSHTVYNVPAGSSVQTFNFEVPVGDIDRLMIRAQQDSGTSFEVFGYFACQGNSKPQFTRTPIPIGYGIRSSSVVFDNTISGLLSDNVEEAITEVNSKLNSANILFDSFNEYVYEDENFGGWNWFSNSEHNYNLASVNNPFPTPALVRGTSSILDKRWDYATLGLVLGDIISVGVPCWFQNSGGEVSIYFRELDGTLLETASVTGLSAGYSNIALEMTVPSGDIDRLMIRVRQDDSTSFEVFGYFACQGNSKPQFVRAVTPKSYISIDAGSVSFDNTDSELSSDNIQDSVKELADLSLESTSKFSSLAFTNLVPDPLHRQLEAGIIEQLGYSTVNQSIVLADFAGNPFLTKALYLPVGQGSVDRNINVDALGLKLNDTIIVKIGVYGDGTLSLGAYFRGSDNAVLSSTGSTASVFSSEYKEITHTVLVTQTILDSAAYLQIRLLPLGGTVTADTYICAWAVHRGLLDCSIQDSTYLEDESRINNSVSIADIDIVIPSEYPVLSGSGSESNIYFDYAIQSIVDLDQVDIVSSNGTQLSECWRLLPVAEHDVVGGDSFSLDFGIYNSDRSLNNSVTTSIKVVEPADTGDVRLLVIGDSITRNGAYVKQVQDVLPNCETVGLRQYGGETFAREGRGGWQLSTYFTRFGNLTTGDSPFLCPIGVAANLYFGNTNQWLSIINDSSAYDHSGFQRIAKDWDLAGDYKYDNVTGRRLSPPEGAVMYDPAVSSYIEYLTGAWGTMSTPPTGFEFDFTKYTQRFAVAFPNGTPTHVAVMSGANDFFSDSNGISDAEWNTYLGYLNEMLDSVTAFDSTIKRIIILPIGCANQDGAGSYNDSGTSSYQFNYTMKQLGRRILNEFDNQANRDVGIHIAPLLTSLDSIGGFPSVTSGRNKYVSDMTLVRQTDQLHPRNEGHYQMGDCLAATVQWCRV